MGLFSGSINPPSLDAVSAYVAERNRALNDFDMDYFRQYTIEVKDEVIEIAMHKARYDCTGCHPALRQASRKWLEERNYKRIGDLPWPPESELPE